MKIKTNIATVCMAGIVLAAGRLYADVPVTSNLVLHLDADAITGLVDGDRIAQWDDLSGEDNHMTQATVANQPWYDATEVDGDKPAVRFEGDQWMTNSVDIGNNAWVFAVFRQTDPEDKQRANLWGSRPEANGVWSDRIGFRLYPDGDDLWRIYGGGGREEFTPPSSALLTAFRVLGAEYDGSTGRVRFDGEQIAAGGIGGSRPLLGFTLGKSDEESGHELDGYIAEMLVYDRDLEAQEIEDIEAYLESKWRPAIDPVVSIQPATNISWATALISGEATDGRPDMNAFVCVDTTDQGDTSVPGDWDYHLDMGIVPPGVEFWGIPTLLASETTYYARVYASNEASVAWSSVIEFETTSKTHSELTLDADTKINNPDDAAFDFEKPYLAFKEKALLPAFHASPWLYDFSIFGETPIDINLSTNMLYQEGSGPLKEGLEPQGTIVLNMNGGNLAGDDGIAIQGDTGTHNILVTNVGDVAMGVVDTHITAGGTVDVKPGSFQVGAEGQPAGDIRIQGVHCFTEVTGTGQVRADGGTVSLYGTGYVQIADSVGTRGDIRTDNETHAGGGDITVVHEGAFLAGTVNSSGGGYFYDRPAGDILLNGGNASDDLDIAAVSASYKADPDSGPSTRATVEIRNYANVILGPIDGYNVYTGDSPATDVIITNNIAGDILLSGSIDLTATNTPDYSGALRLKAGGTVTLAELDLDKVHNAQLDSGSGVSEITGVITNFNTTVDSGSGAKDDPYVTAETGLRAPEGQTVYYTYEDGGLNDYLGGHAWQLKDLDGTTEGGVLMTEPPAGTVILIR